MGPTPSITPQQVIGAVSAVVTQLVAYGVLDKGTAQLVVSVGGIVIPAVFMLATSLHLGRVHAAQIHQKTELANLAPPPVPPPPA